MPPARFLRDYWQKRPLLVRNAFADFNPPLTPDDLAGLACEESALSRIVLHAPIKSKKSLDSPFRGNDKIKKKPSSRPANGQNPVPGTEKPDKWTLRHGPFAESDFTKLPKSHWSLLVQDVDKWDADVAALLDRFAFLPSWRLDDVMMSYATDGGGVGPHIDQYDVFLLQGIGQRHWWINIDPSAPKDFRDDAELKVLREFAPTHEWTLESGDMLYLPPGVPHEGVAVGECMTFSIGMRAPSVAELSLDLVEHLAQRMPEEQRYADPDLLPSHVHGEIDDAALQRARRALGAHAKVINEDVFTDWFCGFITSYRSAQTAASPTRAVTAKAVDAKLERSTFARQPWSRFAFHRAGRGAVLYVAGEKYECPLAWACALAGRERAIDGARLAKLPQRAAGAAVLAALIGAGHLRRLRD